MKRIVSVALAAVLGLGTARADGGDVASRLVVAVAGLAGAAVTYRDAARTRRGAADDRFQAGRAQAIALYEADPAHQADAFRAAADLLDAAGTQERRARRLQALSLGLAVAGGLAFGSAITVAYADGGPCVTYRRRF